jgi:hypothetical protein
LYPSITAIVIVNSLESDGVVHFLLEDMVCLEPGSQRSQAPANAHVHKGDELENENASSPVYSHLIAAGWQHRMLQSDTAKASAARKAVSK